MIIKSYSQFIKLYEWHESGADAPEKTLGRTINNILNRGLNKDIIKSWIKKIPAVIQKSDKSARPQIVVKNKNEKLWDVLNEYSKWRHIEEPYFLKKNLLAKYIFLK
jgi:hypothetical protein